jgi:hypothetical protein
MMRVTERASSRYSHCNNIHECIVENLKSGLNLFSILFTALLCFHILEPTTLIELISFFQKHGIEKGWLCHNFRIVIPFVQSDVVNTPRICHANANE